MIHIPFGFLYEECLEKYGMHVENDILKRMVSSAEMLGIHPCMNAETVYFSWQDSQTVEVDSNSSVIVIGSADRKLKEKLNISFIEVPDTVNMSVIIREVYECFQEMQQLYEHLLEACADRCTLQNLLDFAKISTPNHLYVCDMSFKVLAYTDTDILKETSATWRYQLLHGYLPVHVMKGMIENGEFEKLNGYHRAEHVFSENFYMPFTAKNIFYQGRPQAHLFIVNSVKRPQYRDLAVAQILGDLLERYYLTFAEFRINRSSGTYDSFFRDMIRGSLNERSVIEKQISIWNWKMHDTYLLASIDISDIDKNFYLTVMYQIEQHTDFMCFRMEELLIVISNLSQTSREDAVSHLNRLAGRFQLEICIGIPFHDFARMPEFYYSQLQFLEYAEIYGREAAVIFAADYMIYFIMDELNHDNRLDSLLSPESLILMNHDQQSGTDYFQTYLCYLKQDRNVVKTSRTLHIHRNTLMYRLDKIQSLINFDEENTAKKMHLLMSMLLLDHKKHLNRGVGHWNGNTK